LAVWVRDLDPSGELVPWEDSGLVMKQNVGVSDGWVLQKRQTPGRTRGQLGYAFEEKGKAFIE
jgi:hypothetical protein